MKNLKSYWLLYLAIVVIVIASVVYFATKPKDGEEVEGSAGTGSATKKNGGKSASKPAASGDKVEKPVPAAPKVVLAFEPAMWSDRIATDIQSTFTNDEALYKRLNGFKDEGLRQIYRDFNLRYGQPKFKKTLTRAIQDAGGYFLDPTTWEYMSAVVARLRKMKLN